MNYADAVLYLGVSNAYALAPTHAVIEVKSMSNGPVDEARASFDGVKERLLEQARYFGSRYAVLTRFVETIVFDTYTGEKLAYLDRNEYLDNIDVLWRYISKPEDA